MGTEASPFDSIPYIPLSYDHSDSRNSALTLILTLRPKWRVSKDTVHFTRFTDGITNTLLKATNKLPGLSEAEIDNDAVLLRAYGKGTDVLIDREKESLSHCLLARHDLAPPLFARFNNGLLYKFICGSVCSPADLRRADVWHGVAQRLGEWHATLPISSISNTSASNLGSGSHISPNNKRASLVAMASSLTPGKPIPNIWLVMQKWILALPTATQAQVDRRESLQQELEWLVQVLGDTPGVADSNPFVFAHCDLLSGNVIIEPESPSANNSRRSSQSGSSEDDETNGVKVSFIDYEYTTPAPASFDIANHFAEWGGFECDFTVLPTRSVRRAFLRAYLKSNTLHRNRTYNESDLDELFEQVDRFRGVPGFYWGIWALIQAQISQIDFDYANYAEVRLGEYWAWKKESTGEREKHGEKMPVREARWALEQE